MRPQKRLPRRRSLRRRPDPLRLEDSGDRRSSDLMPHVLQCASDPRVAPGGILLRHPHHEPADFGENARTTAPPLRIHPLVRDQLPMPSENRIRRDDRGDLAQQPPAQALSRPGQPAPVLIGQPHPSSAQLRAEDPIFFNQIRHRRLPLIAPPARKCHQHEPQRRAFHHRGSLHDQHQPAMEADVG